MAYVIIGRTKVTKESVRLSAPSDDKEYQELLLEMAIESLEHKYDDITLHEIDGVIEFDFDDTVYQEIDDLRNMK